MKKIKAEEYTKWNKNLCKDDKELKPLKALKDLREDAKHHLDHHIVYLNKRLDIIEKQLKALKIIKRCPTEITVIIDTYDNWEEYQNDFKKDERWIKTKTEFDLLREVLL